MCGAMIAKALAHEPQILFDERPRGGTPSGAATWVLVRGLCERGVTIIPRRTTSRRRRWPTASA
jgi:hypothetical protein